MHARHVWTVAAGNALSLGSPHRTRGEPVDVTNGQVSWHRRKERSEIGHRRAARTARLRSALETIGAQDRRAQAVEVDRRSPRSIAPGLPHRVPVSGSLHRSASRIDDRIVTRSSSRFAASPWSSAGCDARGAPVIWRSDPGRPPGAVDPGARRAPGRLADRQAAVRRELTESLRSSNPDPRRLTLAHDLGFKRALAIPRQERIRQSALLISSGIVFASAGRLARRRPPRSAVVP